MKNSRSTLRVTALIISKVNQSCIFLKKRKGKKREREMGVEYVEEYYVCHYFRIISIFSMWVSLTKHYVVTYKWMDSVGGLGPQVSPLTL